MLPTESDVSQLLPIRHHQIGVSISKMVEWRIPTRMTLALCAATSMMCILAWALAPRPLHKPTRTHLSKAQRREQQRELRRQQKDLQLQRKKSERAAVREQQERTMTEEQKRERMECIKMQRAEHYQKMDDGLMNGLRVVVDLAFAQAQTQRECNSIFKQLGCAYGYMKKCPLDRVISLRVASYEGKAAACGLRHGVSQWKIHLHEESIECVYNPNDIVYLSPDADGVLFELDPNAVYVIGGIVDRSVRKGQTIVKASGFNYRAKRLPLQEYMDVRKPVLNIDNVLIALNEFANHHDWKRAFEVAIPTRMAKLRNTN